MARRQGYSARHGCYHGNHRGNRHGTPWRPHGIPWQSPRHPNFQGTQVRGWHLGLGLELRLGFHSMPWRREDDSVVCRGRCRGRFCCRLFHGVPRHVVKNDNNVNRPIHSYRRAFFPYFPKFGNNGRYVSIYGGVLSLFVKFSRSKKIKSVKFHIFGKK